MSSQKPRSSERGFLIRAVRSVFFSSRALQKNEQSEFWSYMASRLVSKPHTAAVPKIIINKNILIYLSKYGKIQSENLSTIKQTELRTSNATRTRFFQV